MAKIILILLSITLPIINFAQVTQKTDKNVPVIKKLWFNKIENSFYWVLINKNDTVRIIKTYDGGTELKLGKKITSDILDYITYELEDFGSGINTTIFFDNQQQKFYSVRYNFNGLENEKLLFLSINFQLKKITIDIKSNGKSENYKIITLKELLPYSSKAQRVSS